MRPNLKTALAASARAKFTTRKKENDCRIRQMRLVPEHPQALPDTLEAIAGADLIISGQGASIRASSQISWWTALRMRSRAAAVKATGTECDDAGRRDRGLHRERPCRKQFCTMQGRTSWTCASRTTRPCRRRASRRIWPRGASSSGSLARRSGAGRGPAGISRSARRGRYIRHNPDELAKAV